MREVALAMCCLDMSTEDCALQFRPDAEDQEHEAWAQEYLSFRTGGAKRLNAAVGPTRG